MKDENALPARRSRLLGLDAKDFLDGFARKYPSRVVHRVQPALMNNGHTVREPAHGVQVVDGYRNRLARFRQPAAEFKYLQRMLHVEVGGRLVEQDDVCLRSQTSRQQNALFLTAREFVRKTPGEMGNIGALQGVMDRLAVLTTLAAETAQVGVSSHGNHVLDGKGEIEALVLGYERHLFRNLAPGKHVEWLAVKPGLPFGRTPQPGQQAKNRRFPGAVHADERRQPAGLQP